MLAGPSPGTTPIVKTALANSFRSEFTAAMAIMPAGSVVAPTLPNADLDEEAPAERETGGETIVPRERERRHGSSERPRSRVNRRIRPTSSRRLMPSDADGELGATVSATSR